MAWRGSLVAALLATLAHPRWWAIALAAFLVRGGFVVILLPIIVPPTVASVAVMVVPAVMQLASNGPGNPVAAFVLAVAAVGLLGVMLAGGLGASFDAALAAEAADDEDLAPAGGLRAREPRPAGLGSARLWPHLVTAIVLVVAIVQVVVVAYREATTLGAPTTPFAIRVLAETALPVAACVATWFLAEAAGGLALRALLLGVPGEPAPRVRVALGHGARSLLRGRVFATLVVTNVATVVVALPGAFAAARAWSQLRLLFIDGADALGLAIGLLLFVGVLMGWLALLAVALAWRSTAWTAVAAAIRAA